MPESAVHPPLHARPTTYPPPLPFSPAAPPSPQPQDLQGSLKTAEGGDTGHGVFQPAQGAPETGFSTLLAEKLAEVAINESRLTERPLHANRVHVHANPHSNASTWP